MKNNQLMKKNFSYEPIKIKLPLELPQIMQKTKHKNVISMTSFLMYILSITIINNQKYNNNEIMHQR